MSELNLRDYDLRRLRIEASRLDCPNGPDEEGNWPCDPQGYGGVAECQVCGRVGLFLRPDIASTHEPEPSAADLKAAKNIGIDPRDPGVVGLVDWINE